MPRPPFFAPRVGVAAGRFEFIDISGSAVSEGVRAVDAGPVADREDASNAIDRHLADAIRLLADCFPDEGPARQHDLVEVARQIALARERLAKRPAAPVPATGVDPESPDARIERKAADAVQRTNLVLAGMDLSAPERQWARDVGSQVVDLVGDAYRRSVRQADGYCGTCVTAAVAVALAIVYDPPEDHRGG